MEMLEAASLAVDPLELIEPMRETFTAVSAGRANTTFGLLDIDGGDVHVKAGYLTGGSTFAVKVASAHPGNAARGLPTAGGAIIVYDAATGRPVAFLADDHRITDARTAAAAALATDLLADASADVAAVLGTGVQAELQAVALSATRKLSRLVVWGRRPDRAARLVDRLRERVGIRVDVADSARAAVGAAPIVLTTTASQEPVLCGSWLEPGHHVTASGADDDHKRECDTSCFERAGRVVVDSREQTMGLAELRHALDDGAVSATEIVELGEVIRGDRPGRRSSREVTIAKLTGLAVQDLAAAEHVLGRRQA